MEIKKVRNKEFSVESISCLVRVLIKKKGKAK